MAEVDLSNVPRDSRRVPIATKVLFKFERFSGFISEYSANISPTGMFITTTNPEPAGSILDFEFRLGDGFEIIQGKGEVVWTRAVAEGPNRPPGIGIRFLDLSPVSKELIYRIVDQYVLDGGTPFDVSLIPPDPIVPRAAAPAAPASPLAGPAARGQAPLPPPALPPEPFELEPPLAFVAPSLDEPEPFSLPPADAPWVPSPQVGAAYADDLRAPDPYPSSDLDPSVSPDAPWSAPSSAPTFSSLTGRGASVQHQRSLLPWAVIAVLVVLGLAAWLFRERLLGMVGLGGAAEGTEVAAAPPGPRGPGRISPGAPGAPAASAVAAGPIAQPTPSEEPAGPLPEVVRRKPPATASTPATSAPSAPVPTPTPAAPPVPPSATASAGPRASAVERITWERSGDGTDLILWGNGSFPAGSWNSSRLPDPPRQLVVLNGIARNYPATRVAVGTGELKQVRIALHEKPGGSQLHVVLDLGGAAVKVTRVEAREKQLRIHLQGS
jgi:uncharacterized protein (TIGR02266 family)